jgi:phage terminase large subunit-like protein
MDAARKPNILAYEPISENHKNFHGSNVTGRILIGGNRAGKSVAGTVEGLYRALGRHPYQQVPPPPTRGRIVTVDIPSGIEQIIIPLLKQWTPKSELVNGSWEDSYSARKKLLTLRNESTIEIKTHEQEVESFAGVPLHWCHFDEEPPLSIFNECRLRLLDFNGCWFMTMTPVEGQDWIFERMIQKKSKNVEVFQINPRDNKHISQEAQKILEEDLTEEEKEVRVSGIFVPKGGVILREFDPEKHIIEPGPVPRTWAIYVSIDHGFNNPTAILWHAVSPDGKVVTFMEHYKAGMTVALHVENIIRINHEFKVRPEMYICDPSMSQKNGITATSVMDEYRRLDIPVVAGKKDVHGGINKMNEYFRQNKWFITENCPNLAKEIPRYSWKTYTSEKIADRSNKREEPNKKNDHAIDSSKYFFSFMPQLEPEIVPSKKNRITLTKTNREDFPWNVDEQLLYPSEKEVVVGFGEVY